MQLACVLKLHFTGTYGSCRVPNTQTLYDNNVDTRDVQNQSAVSAYAFPRSIEAI